jgi:hypothetical protein
MTLILPKALISPRQKTPKMNFFEKNCGLIQMSNSKKHFASSTSYVFELKLRWTNLLLRFSKKRTQILSSSCFSFFTKPKSVHLIFYVT